MKMKTLGRTGLRVTENSFGALPIQRISEQEACDLLRYAYESGVNFFDTARFYTDSEHKIGVALSQVRDKIIIATKSMGRTKSAALADLEVSLREMQTDFVDIWQLHNIPELPDTSDPDGPSTEGKTENTGDATVVWRYSDRLKIMILVTGAVVGLSLYAAIVIPSFMKKKKS